jgi:ABC-type transporter Mla subunit MlaD
MNRRRGQNPLRSPVLIGALTVLVTVVAVILAFQANNGLPFVPRYNLHVEVRNAEELTRGGEVHEGGTLIGSINSVSAARDRRGRPIAIINIALDRKVQPLPIDTRFTIRLKTSIGEKYLDVRPGRARRTFANGATVPVRNTSATVDLDQVLSMFTPPTRAGVAASTVGFGNALAGRGADLNNAIGAFVPLVTALAPVMRNLSSPKTDLEGFIQGLDAFTAALAPVASEQAELFQNLDTTFGALAGVARPYLQELISQTPPTFETVIKDGPAIGAFATDTAQLFADLRPGVALLPTTAPKLASAFAAGARNLTGTTELDRQLVALSRSLSAYSANPTAQQGLDRLTLTANSLISPLGFLTPVQSSCNYMTLFLRNLASDLSDNVGSGTVLRFVLVSIDQVTGGEAVPSHTPFLSSNPAGGTQHGPLHVNPYPYTDSPGQPRACAAGNERYSAASALIGNPPGNVGLKTEATKASAG